MNILLDYFFPITSIEPTAAASTAFLKQACLVVSPGSGVTPEVIVECSSMAEVAEVTDNLEAQQLFDGGMSKVYILPVDDLDLQDALDGVADFYTLLISSDFTDEEITLANAEGVITITSYANLVSGTDDSITVEGVVFTAQTGAVTEGATTFRAATGNSETAASLAAQINAHATVSLLVTAVAEAAVVTLTAVESGLEGNSINISYTDNDTNVGATVSGAALTGGAGLVVGDFDGVIGVSSDDDSYLEDQAAIDKRCAFHSTTGNKAKNMCYAFGKMLSNSSAWRSQQYISMPVADDVETLGDANSLFDEKISFVISDDEYGERLALFAAGGKAIVAPYIKKNLQIDFQSAALAYISGNQPSYTKKHAALLEDELKKVVQEYIADLSIEAGTVEVDLVEDNFIATGALNISEPGALWRIQAEMRQTL